MSPASLGAKISTTVRAQNSAPAARVRLQLRAVAALTQWAPGWMLPWLARQFLSPRSRERPLDVTGARSVRLCVGQRSVRVASFGAGPAVLLVHGWAGSGEQFRALREALVTAGYSALAFDAPAHGQNVERTTSLLDFAAIIAAIAEHFGPLHALVGHSLGATAAALFAHRAGEAHHGAPGLALLAPMPGFEFAIREFGAALHLSPASQEQLSQHLEAHLGFSRADFELDTIHPPPNTLICHDAGDRAIPIACSRSLAAAWGNVRLVETHGLGHRRTLDDPKVVEALVEFVQQLPHIPRSSLNRQLAGLDDCWFQ
jgi:pimeloyl-ACP methyl ester carboxylesterase